jgi:hypothetical protein
MNAQQTERFAASRVDEAIRRLRLALEAADACEIFVARWQLRIARKDLRRAISSAAAAAERKAVRR